MDEIAVAQTLRRYQRLQDLSLGKIPNQINQVFTKSDAYRMNIDWNAYNLTIEGWIIKSKYIFSLSMKKDRSNGKQSQVKNNHAVKEILSFVRKTFITEMSMAVVARQRRSRFFSPPGVSFFFFYRRGAAAVSFQPRQTSMLQYNLFESIFFFLY